MFVSSTKVSRSDIIELNLLLLVAEKTAYIYSYDSKKIPADPIPSIK